MIKKIFVVFSIILILSGCTAEYTLNIDNNLNTSEELIVNNYNDFIEISNFNKHVSESFNYSDITFEAIGTSNNYYLKANRNIKSSKLNNDEALNEIFGILNWDKIKKKIEFTPDKDMCIYSFYEGDSEDNEVSNSSLIINVNVPFKVLSSNADKINNNIYTWEYNLSNCNKTIYINYEHVSFGEMIIYGLIIVSIIVFVTTMIIKSKKSNAI